MLQRRDRIVRLYEERAAKAQKLPVRIQPPRTVGGRYPWFVDGLRRQLQDDERLGRTREARTQRLFEGGLRIHTTLDPDMQIAAEQAVARWRPPSGPDIALVAIDPRDGGVRAVVEDVRIAARRIELLVRAVEDDWSSRIETATSR